MTATAGVSVEARDGRAGRAHGHPGLGLILGSPLRDRVCGGHEIEKTRGNHRHVVAGAMSWLAETETLQVP